MQNNYETNIRLERRFAKIIKQILGLQFIGQDPVMDKEQGTDFLTFSIQPIKVGVRLRTKGYYDKYKNQFTIRWSLFSGGKTEIHKIREGLVDYILYGFVDEEEKNIIQYFIGDLNIFRDWEQGMIPDVYQNKDARPTKLAVYNIDTFPKEFIIKFYNKLDKQ